MSKYEDVNNFLKKTKTYIIDHNIFLVKKTQDDIMNLGLTHEIVKKYILELEIEDYVEGPLIDKQYNGCKLWVFGIFLKDIHEEIYIKLSSRLDNQRPVCVSFHKSYKPLNYPFKTNTQNSKPLRI